MSSHLNEISKKFLHPKEIINLLRTTVTLEYPAMEI